MVQFACPGPLPHRGAGKNKRARRKKRKKEKIRQRKHEKQSRSSTASSEPSELPALSLDRGTPEEAASYWDSPTTAPPGVIGECGALACPEPRRRAGEDERARRNKKKRRRKHKKQTSSSDSSVGSNAGNDMCSPPLPAADPRDPPTTAPPGISGESDSLACPEPQPHRRAEEDKCARRKEQKRQREHPSSELAWSPKEGTPRQAAGSPATPGLESNAFAMSKDRRLCRGDPGASWPAADECDPQVVATVRTQIKDFLLKDSEDGGAASRNWPRLLQAAYPPHGPCWRAAASEEPTLNEAAPAASQGESTLEEMLLILVMRTYRAREKPERQARPAAAIEYFAGKAAVTRERLALGLPATRFDKEYGDHHDCLTAAGLALWLDELAFTIAGSLQWFGTQCSSWVILCISVSRRNAENGFWGDTSRGFVRQGNEQMIITSLIFFVAWLLQNSPVLEQPQTSVMCHARPMCTVLEFIGATRTATYLSQFGGCTMKPLQLWHVGPAYGALSRPYPIKFVAKTTLVKRLAGNRFSGKRHQLKASQAYPPAFGVAVAAITDRALSVGRASHP